MTNIRYAAFTFPWPFTLNLPSHLPLLISLSLQLYLFLLKYCTKKIIFAWNCLLFEKGGGGCKPESIINVLKAGAIKLSRCADAVGFVQRAKEKYDQLGSTMSYKWQKTGLNIFLSRKKERVVWQNVLLLLDSFPLISCPELKEPHPYLTISRPVILWLLGRYLQCDIVVTLYNVQCSFVQLCNIGNVSRHHILASAYFNWQNHAKNWGLQICFDVNAKEMAAG